MEQKTIYALGYFDGVHRGHTALLTACRDLAAQGAVCSGAVTFLGHPQQLLQGETPRLINTPEDRRAFLLEQVDTVLELAFDREMMQTDWDSFLQKLVREHGAAGFVCGSDFRFGQGGRGTARCLQTFCAQNGLSCAVVAQQTVDGIRVSSTHIRRLLEKGEMEAAERFLGHLHCLGGKVVYGRQLGRTIGLPTANIHYPDILIRLPAGVYACAVTVERETYPAVTNVGIRPTVEGEKVNAETHLLGYSGDLYGKTIKIEFRRFLRPERKFSDLEQLRLQILQDIEDTK